MKLQSVLSVCLLLSVLSVIDGRRGRGRGRGAQKKPRGDLYTWLRQSMEEGGDDFRQVAMKPADKDKLWFRSYSGADARRNAVVNPMVYVYPEGYSDDEGILAIRYDSRVCMVANITESLSDLLDDAADRNVSTETVSNADDDLLVLRATVKNCELRATEPSIGHMCRRTVVYETEELDVDDESDIDLEDDETMVTVSTFTGSAILIYPTQLPEVCARQGRRGRGGPGGRPAGGRPGRPGRAGRGRGSRGRGSHGRGGRGRGGRGRPGRQGGASATIARRPPMGGRGNRGGNRG